MLPYGAGYDQIIKAKAELIDSQKQANNLVMDQLVWKLGYMDYRDALACNKYIVETKLSGDYEQIARGQILQSALARLSTQKREEIRKNATQRANESFAPNSVEHRQASDKYQMDQIMD